mgnify:CR=1 FL=1
MSRNHRAAFAAKRLQPSELPKFWRPKLTEAQRTDAQIIHWDLIARFTDGSATAEDLWDWIETGFTYARMLNLLAEDGSEFTPEAIAAITELLDSHHGVIDRFRRTHRIGFDAEQLRIARAAACVMDALIDMDRHGIAERAARWSIQQTQAARRMAASAPQPSHPQPEHHP